LINLVLNAKDAMPKGGEITITTKIEPLPKGLDRTEEPQANIYVHLSVSDQGIGIPEEALNRIFEPFSTTKERESGTGLGLAIAYSIVEDHNGYIFAESQEGEGAVFHVYLPIAKSEETR
jgi:two-component system cell cycle sensor histidine kinase/response regulator CckA